MSKDIETMINEAPVLTLDPFSTSELPAESSQAVPAELDRVHSRGRADTGGAKDDRQFRGEN